jgi:hypothetical protein
MVQPFDFPTNHLVFKWSTLILSRPFKFQTGYQMAENRLDKMVAVYVVQFIQAGFQVIQYSNARLQLKLTI